MNGLGLFINAMGSSQPMLNMGMQQQSSFRINGNWKVVPDGTFNPTGWNMTMMNAGTSSMTQTMHGTLSHCRWLGNNRWTTTSDITYNWHYYPSQDRIVMSWQGKTRSWVRMGGSQPMMNMGMQQQSSFRINGNWKVVPDGTFNPTGWNMTMMNAGTSSMTQTMHGTLSHCRWLGNNRWTTTSDITYNWHYYPSQDRIVMSWQGKTRSWFRM
eukprot:g2097.t1